MNRQVVESEDVVPPGQWLPRYWFANQRYAVEACEVATFWGKVTQLAIRRRDGEEVTSWDDLQVIKNELVGPERVALEVYPPQSELVRISNCRHLWVLPEGAAGPFPAPDAAVRDAKRLAADKLRPDDRLKPEKPLGPNPAQAGGIPPAPSDSLTD